MNRYRYRAIDANGEPVAAEVDAATASEALVHIEKQGLVVASFEIVPPDKVAAEAELAIFYSELQGVLDRRQEWLPRVQSIIAELPHGMIRRRLIKQAAEMERVTTPQEFVEHRDAIDLLPLIASPSWSDASRRSRSEWLVKYSTMVGARARTMNSLAYPAILFFLVISVYVVLSIFVIHGIRAFFDAIDVRVPNAASSLFWLSDQVNNHAIRTLGCLLVGCIVLIFAIRWWRNLALTNVLCGRFVAGTASNLLAMSELIGTLALLLEMKAPLGLALTIAGRQCKHDYFRQAIESLAMDAKKGVVSEFPLQAKKRLPPLLLHALRSSESSKPNLPLLYELSAVYRDRARLRRDWISSSGPSLAVFVVGLFVLWLVVGLLSPLFMLSSSFSN